MFQLLAFVLPECWTWFEGELLCEEIQHITYHIASCVSVGANLVLLELFNTLPGPVLISLFSWCGKSAEKRSSQHYAGVEFWVPNRKGFWAFTLPGSFIFDGHCIKKRKQCKFRHKLPSTDAGLLKWKYWYLRGSAAGIRLILRCKEAINPYFSNYYTETVSQLVLNLH